MEETKFLSDLASPTALFSVIAFVATVVYFTSSLLSPLSKIPDAHYLAKWTSLWILRKRKKSQEFDVIHQAHLDYGPIVRLSPHEVAVNRMADGISIVHGSPGFDKTDWYDAFINHGQRNAFSTYASDSHALLRRRYARVYGKSYLQTSPHLLKILTYNSLGAYISEAEHEASPGKGVDVLQLNLAYALDITTSLLWGSAVGTKMVPDRGERDEWARHYDDSHPPGAMFWLLELPKLTRLVEKLLPHWLVPTRHYAGKKWLEDWALRKVRMCEQRCVEDDSLHFDKSEPGEAPIVYGTIRKSFIGERVDGYQQDKSTLPRLAGDDELLAASECLDHIFATRDTFGVTLTYLMYQMGRSTMLQNRLHEELCGSLPDAVVTAIKMQDLSEFGKLASSLRLSAILESLPFLDAVLREGLRLRNIPPLAQPRLVPACQTIQICGFDLPPGTKVSCYATSTHHMPYVFANPSAFDPDRWMQDDQSALRNMQDSFWPMGKGSRICLGQHLAMDMLRYLLAVVFVRYSIHVVDDKDFGNGGGYIDGGRDDHLYLEFTKRVT